ncbi:hypothetical protein LPB140_01335 [Sphingorhabdus lutea]|uniref:Uncharacterized protein n=1 Tax=Sphingorhabdus lutea TaxID=1913578 RepID=A0A1L3J9B7_9SPHN|nr:diacylglycerol kinase family protein [Sphingorhabdus lutea]APG61701.1 hypothetical protein LPB140_01335 [Sphingorhabdus lutea]
MKILLAYNGCAGSFCPNLLAMLRQKLEQSGHEIFTCDSHDGILCEQMGRMDHICIIGGDGTLRDVVARLSPDEHLPSFSIFPLGTINLIAREAGFNQNIDALVKRINAHGHDIHKCKKHYGCTMNGENFLACASISPDSYAVAQLSPSLKRKIGRMAYCAAFLQNFWVWPRPNLSILADGKHFKGEAAFLLKGKFYAGPWNLSPKANVQHEKIELIILPTARRRDYLRLMLSAMISRKFVSPKWAFISCTNIAISGDKADIPVQADGDFTGHLPINAQIDNRPIYFI